MRRLAWSCLILLLGLLRPSGCGEPRQASPGDLDALARWIPSDAERPAWIGLPADTARALITHDAPLLWPLARGIFTIDTAALTELPQLTSSAAGLVPWPLLAILGAAIAGPAGSSPAYCPDTLPGHAWLIPTPRQLPVT